MKKFVIGIVTGLVLAAFTVVILFFALVRIGDRRPSVSDNSVLVLKLRGDVPEKPGIDIPFPPFNSDSAPTIHEHWAMLRKAAADSRIKAVVLAPSHLGTGWAKVQELRNNVLAFRKSGKPVYAWLESPGTREYYLATAADKVFVAPEDFVDVKGLRAEMAFFRNTLDKLGVQVEIVHIGKYKDAGDMFTRTSMSPETREVMDSVLDGIYGNILQTIASGRKKTVDQVRDLIDNGPYLAKEAQKHGLIDGTIYEDEVYGQLAKKVAVAELKKISSHDYFRAGGTVMEGQRIALVVGQGAIFRGESRDLSDDGIYSASFIKLVRQAANDSTIRGVILRIDSPGGDAMASDDILREVKLLSKKKPTVVSMSDTAASGGYFMAMTGDPIVAYPNTFTGSIGVIFGKVNLRGLYDKLGIQKDIMTRGQNAAIDTDYGPMSEAARKKLQESLDSIYSGFVKRVADGRKQSYEKIDELAQGRVWLGSQAKANDLVDDLGGLDRAVELVKAKAKIPAGDKVRLVPFPARKTFLDALLQTSGGSLVEAKARSLWGGTPVGEVLDGRLRGQVNALLHGGVFRMMPYMIDVR